jgi:hypothetical protein
MRPVSGWAGIKGKRSRNPILLQRLQYEKKKIRCETKPVAVRCDDQRVGTVVLVINAAREQAVPWLPLRR